MPLAVLFKIQESSSFLTPEMTAMDPDTLRSWVYDDPALADFRHLIDEVIRSRAHVLSTREEPASRDGGSALESMDSAFTMLDSVDLKRGEIADEKGNRVELTDGLFGKFRDSRDRRVRADAFQAMHTAFAGMGNTIAALYAGNVAGGCVRCKARRFDSCLDQALFADNLPRSVYTGLIEAVRAHLPSYYRYLELRRRRLGVEKLHIYDCYLPDCGKCRIRNTPMNRQSGWYGVPLRRWGKPISGIWTASLPAAGWTYMKPGERPPALMRPGFTAYIPICC